MADQTRRIAGLDLGTTYSAVARFDDFGKPEVIPNLDGERTTPSVVLFEDDEVIVGRIAKNQAVSNPDRIAQFVKRSIGDADWRMDIDGREYTPELLSAIIVRKMIGDVEASIGETITDLVITCPAYFNDAERTATMEAGMLAGFNVLGIINEPTAAALAYGMNKRDRSMRVLVYDLGGGTFDVTILEIEGRHFRVLATDGERRLGGKDWDDEIVAWVCERFEEEHGTSPRDDVEAYQDLVLKAEEAKRTLTRKPRARIFCQCAGKSASYVLTRDELEELTRPLLEQTETYLDIVLGKSGLTWDEIDAVLPVGGMTRVPSVRDMLVRVTGREPERGVNPDECVALGATYWAAILLMRESARVQELIESGVEGVDALPVEEAVPEALRDYLPGVVVSNVNSHSFGIVTERADGSTRNRIMIPEQTSLPAESTQTFTLRANQVSAEIRVLEGETEDPDDCIEVGTAVFGELPCRPREALVRVTYRYGEDGLLDVRAIDLETGRAVDTTVVRKGSVGARELQRQRRDVDRLVGVERETAVLAVPDFGRVTEQRVG